MKVKEAVDYGYMPKEVRDNLNPHSKLPVSHQIELMISTGVLGAEGLRPSLEAARAEYQLVYLNGEDEQAVLKAWQSYETCTAAISNPLLRSRICQAKALEYVEVGAANLESGFEDAGMSYLKAAKRWSSIGNQSHLRIIK